MKKIIFPTLTILLATLLLAVMPTEAEGAIYSDTIRLHILANSDTEVDQNLKLLIRDDVLSEFGEELSVFKNVNSAKDSVEEKLPKIKEFVEEKIKEYGYYYTAEVTLSEEWYDTRDYENFSLPKGYYTSLRIIIGNGDGKNWWCVMFPPLCLDAAVDDNTAYSDREEIIINNKYSIKFKLLELVSELGK